MKMNDKKLKISNDMTDREIEEALDTDSVDSEGSKEGVDSNQKTIPLKKAKPFNRLDERFQWNPSLDENHIFPEELKMIQQLRKEFGTEVSTWKDKTLLYFLISRRHDFNLTKELLRKHLDKAKELGFDKNPPTFEDVREFYKGANMCFKGSVDKHDRLIVYYKIGLEFSKPNINKYKLLFWDTFYRCDIEPIKYLRNGIIIIVDMSGFGWKNVDMSSDAKEFYSAMTGMFPRRVRGMYVVNGGHLTRIVLKAGKLILSKKIMKRISVLDKKGIKELIPPQWLLSELGGTCKLTFDDSVQEIVREEKLRRTSNSTSTTTSKLSIGS